jgi:class 3 adenylate cyclase/tetratricopeptide (TPR) repeat protein
LAEPINAESLNKQLNSFSIYKKISVLNNELQQIDDKSSSDFKILLNISKEIAVNSKNPDAVALYYNSLGDFYYESNDLEKAGSFYSKAEQLVYKVKNQTIIAENYRNLGVLNTEYNKYDKAQEYFDKALEISELIKDNKVIANIYSSMSIMYMNKSELDKSADYARKALTLRLKLDSKRDIIKSYTTLGNILGQASSYEEALENHFKALKLAEETNETKWIAGCNNNIGAIYNSLNETSKALEYYLKGAKIREKNDRNSVELAYSYNNLAIIYKKLKNYDLSIEYLKKSMNIKKIHNDLQGIASSSNNLGSTYISAGKYDLAEKYINDAYIIYNKMQNNLGIVGALNNFGFLYMQKKDFPRALKYSRMANELSLKVGNKQHSLRSYGLTVKIYEYMGDFKNAYLYHQKYFDYKDSLFNAESEKQMAEIQTKYETEKKEKENTLLKQEKLVNELRLSRNIYWRRFLTFILGSVVIIAFLIYYMYKKQRYTNKLIQIEKEKTDSLLLNILPIEIAKELKEKGETTPQSFDNVTVIFSDLVNFTETVSKFKPEKVINELNELFTQFDNIMEKNNCERIKTIGDAYLAVCGMPEPNPDHAVNIVKSAIEMIRYIQNRNSNNEIRWSVRIGIHTGSVVGGVVGIKKYIYDIFGDTINTTSRIETQSLPMQINISETTYELVKNEFTFTENKTVDVKGKGEIKMYMLSV